MKTLFLIALTLISASALASTTASTTVIATDMKKDMTAEPPLTIHCRGQLSELQGPSTPIDRTIELPAYQSVVLAQTDHFTATLVRENPAIPEFVAVSTNDGQFVFSTAFNEDNSLVSHRIRGIEMNGAVPFLSLDCSQH